jgi:3-hydroxypropanoate dehydrogenase
MTPRTIDQSPVAADLVRLPTAAFDQLFLRARSRNAWQKIDVAEAVWRELYDIAKFG